MVCCVHIEFPLTTITRVILKYNFKLNPEKKYGGGSSMPMLLVNKTIQV